jgi:hypothetical protein
MSSGPARYVSDGSAQDATFVLTQIFSNPSSQMSPNVTGNYTNMYQFAGNTHMTSDFLVAQWPTRRFDNLGMVNNTMHTEMWRRSSENTTYTAEVTQPICDISMKYVVSQTYATVGARNTMPAYVTLSMTPRAGRNPDDCLAEMSLQGMMYDGCNVMQTAETSIPVKTRCAPPPVARITCPNEKATVNYDGSKYPAVPLTADQSFN